MQAIPAYTMSTFRAPTSVCNSLDSMVRKFWWGVKTGTNKTLSLKAWTKICQPKEFRGLGCRLFKEINTILLAKLGWKVAQGDEDLWVKVLFTKYLHRSSFFAHVSLQNASHV